MNVWTPLPERQLGKYEVNLLPELPASARRPLSSGLFRVVVPQPSVVFEHLAFGIDSFGDYGDGNGRPDWFQDVRVRRALAMCTDRQGIMEQTLFGRRFDVALFGWLSSTEPPCQNWQSGQIFGSAGAAGDLDAAGWSNDIFDAACQQAQRAFWGSPDYVAGHQDAWRIFAEELPAVPLFPRVKMAAARPEVLNFGVDASQNSELWNLFEIDLE